MAKNYMKAVSIEKYGGAEVLQYKEHPVPEIKEDEILISVKNSSINPVDWKIRKGMLKFLPGQKLPKILGGDIAGIVYIVGENISEFKIGDEVYGLISASSGGAYAEYAIAKLHQISYKPRSISFEEAGSIPLAALTAYQGLNRDGNIKKGDQVIINGCSGGVGHFAIQIAKAMGAEVTGVCSTKNIELSKILGADIVIDYTKNDIFNTDIKYDIFYDTVANQSFKRVKKYLKKGGRYITTLPSLGVILNPVTGIMSTKSAKMSNVRPTSEDIRFLSELIKSNKLRVHIDRTYQLNDIQDAHRYSETGRVVGKLALSIN